MCGGAAALLLGMSHNLLIHNAIPEDAKPKLGKVRRRIQRVSHAQRISPWYYNREDVLAWRARRIEQGKIPLRPEDAYDKTKKYVTALQASWLLGVHTTAIYTLNNRRGEVDGIRIRTKRCEFTFPHKRTGTGYLLTDILALRERREATQATPAFVEECVTASTLEETATTERQYIAYSSTVFDCYSAGTMSAEDVVEALRKRIPR